MEKTIFDLPTEILVLIINGLESDDAINVFITCKTFYSLKHLTCYDRLINYDNNSLTVDKKIASNEFLNGLNMAFPNVHCMSLKWKNESFKMNCFQQFTSLEKLELNQMEKNNPLKFSVEPLQISQITTLIIKGFFQDVCFKSLSNLRHLDIDSYYMLSPGTIKRISTCTLIETIRISSLIINNKNYEYIRMLNQCTNLRSLDFLNLVNECTKSYPLYGLTTLERLIIRSKHVSDTPVYHCFKDVPKMYLDRLRSMIKLKELKVINEGNGFVKTFSVLGAIMTSLTNLEDLSIYNKNFAMLEKDIMNVVHVNLPQLKSFTVKLNNDTGYHFQGLSVSNNLRVVNVGKISWLSFNEIIKITSLTSLTVKYISYASLGFLNFSAFLNMINLSHLCIGIETIGYDVSEIRSIINDKNGLSNLQSLSIAVRESEFILFKVPYVTHYRTLLSKEIDDPIGYLRIPVIDCNDDNAIKPMIVTNNIMFHSAIPETVNDSFQLDNPVKLEWIDIIKNCKTTKAFDDLRLKIISMKTVSIEDIDSVKQLENYGSYKGKHYMFCPQFKSWKNCLKSLWTVFDGLSGISKHFPQKEIVFKIVVDRIHSLSNEITIRIKVNNAIDDSIQWLSIKSDNSVNTTKLTDNELTDTLRSSGNHIKLLIESGYKCIGSSILSSLTTKYVYEEHIRRAMWIRDSSVIQITYPRVNWGSDTLVPFKATSMIPV